MPVSGSAWRPTLARPRRCHPLLHAAPHLLSDIHSALRNIVIGPQGVFEEARVTATHEKDWLDVPARGEGLEFDVLIFFPWDPEKRLFAGERVHFQLGAEPLPR